MSYENKSPKKLVVIGGGTGSFALLSELKHYFSDITALVNMVDDGGSTGVLRDELGVLPPGDVRQCLVALSDAPEKLRRLFNFRFAQGTFAGHSFGNIFLSAVERMTDSFDEAVTMTSDILKIHGRVLPMTIDNCQLQMKIGDKVISGESAVGNTTIPAHTKPDLYIKPPASMTPLAREALQAADMIVIAPGNLYCSLVPSLLVDGVSECLIAATAELVYVANLVNKPNHTQDFSVIDYVEELERFIGENRINTVLYNNDTPDERLMKRYALDGEYPIKTNKRNLSNRHFVAIGGSFLQKGKIEQNSNDTRVPRSYIRHDGLAVAKALKQHVEKQ
jgi:uncharacterized cofD-like protein